MCVLVEFEVLYLCICGLRSCICVLVEIKVLYLCVSEV